MSREGRRPEEWSTRWEEARAPFPAPRLTFPIASRPLSKKNMTPRTVKRTPKPVRPTPISVRERRCDEGEEGRLRRKKKQNAAGSRARPAPRGASFLSRSLCPHTRSTHCACRPSWRQSARRQGRWGAVGTRGGARSMAAAGATATANGGHVGGGGRALPFSGPLWRGWSLRRGLGVRDGPAVWRWLNNPRREREGERAREGTLARGEGE